MARDTAPSAARDWHALPRWFEGYQDRVGLTIMLLAGMILNGLFFSTGIVTNIEDGPQVWGLFHTVLFVGFFLFGTAVTGVTLRLSAAIPRLWQLGSWFLAIVLTLLALAVFFPMEVWASITIRSTTHIFTPADDWVLHLIGHPELPISPTIMGIALLSAIIPIVWGLVVTPPPVVNLEDEQQRLESQLQRAEMMAKIRTAQARGAANVGRALRGKPTVRTDHAADLGDMLSDASSEPSVTFTPSGGGLRALPRTNAPSGRTEASERIVDGSVASIAQNIAPSRRTSARVKARQTRKARSVRTGEPGNASYEPAARAAWADGSRTVGKMMTATGMSKNAAAGWVRTLKAEAQAAQ